MAITMAVLLISLISILGLVEVGYLYWARRNVQKVADLAALSGAQRLKTCTPGNGDNAAARYNAVHGNNFNGTLDITCGYWDPSVAGEEHFTAATAAHPRNSVRVVANMPATPFFGFAHFTGVGATAIATHHGKPIASFSVGSRLLGLNTDDSLLGPLLSGVLGTSLGLKLLSYDGIANSNLSLLGLKNVLHLDAGTVDGVLNTEVSLGDFLDAVVQVLQQGPDTANIDIGLVNQQIANIKAQLGDTDIKLGDILNVHAGTSDPDTALDVDVNVADILNAALQAANSKHAAALDISNLDLLGLASVKLKLAIIEPPKIGVGRPGYNPDGTPRTVAHTAQVRLKLEVEVLQGFGNNGVLLNLSPIAKVSFPGGKLIEIPLNLELVPAEAWIDNLQCHVPVGGQVRNVATMKLRPGALNLFLGHLPDGTYDSENQRWQDVVDAAIADGTAYANLLALKVQALAHLVNLDARLQVYASAPVVRADDAIHQFVTDPAIPIPEQPGMTWTADTGQHLLGSALAALFTSDLLKVHLDLDSTGLLGLLTPIVEALVNAISPLVSALLGILRPVLLPIFNALDQLLVGPLLHLLGIQIGAADATLTSINCNTGVQLVY